MNTVVTQKGIHGDLEASRIFITKRNINNEQYRNGLKFPT